jgi:hypothetical protein
VVILGLGKRLLIWFPSEASMYLVLPPSCEWCSVLPLHRTQLLWRGQMASLKSILSDHVSGSGSRAYRWDHTPKPNQTEPNRAHPHPTRNLSVHCLLFPNLRSVAPHHLPCCGRPMWPPAPPPPAPSLCAPPPPSCDATGGTLIPPLRPPPARPTVGDPSMRPEGELIGGGLVHKEEVVG